MMKPTVLKQLPAPPAGKLRVVLDMDKTLIIAHKVDVQSPEALGEDWSEKQSCGVAPNASMSPEDIVMSKPDLQISNMEIRKMGWPYAQDERQVWLRPGLLDFLDRISEFAEIIVWTLSEYRLARRIVQKFDKNGRISGLVGREVNGQQQRFRGYWFDPLPESSSKSTKFSSKATKKYTGDDGGASEKGDYHPKYNLELDDVNEVHIDLSHLTSRLVLPAYVQAEVAQHVEIDWVKDLSMLNCELSRTVIVDDWAELMLFNPNNSIVIPEFRFPDRQMHDNALAQIYDVLKGFASPLVDVRHHLFDDSMAHLRFLHTLHQGHRQHCEQHRPWVGPYEASTAMIKQQMQKAGSTYQEIEDRDVSAEESAAMEGQMSRLSVH